MKSLKTEDTKLKKYYIQLGLLGFSYLNLVPTAVYMMSWVSAIYRR